MAAVAAKSGDAALAEEAFRAKMDRGPPRAGLTAAGCPMQIRENRRQSVDSAIGPVVCGIRQRANESFVVMKIYAK